MTLHIDASKVCRFYFQGAEKMHLKKERVKKRNGIDRLKERFDQKDLSNKMGKEKFQVDGISYRRE